MGIDIASLSPQAQKQVLEKVKAQKRKLPIVSEERKESKYRNQKTEVSGIQFDSKKEARRFVELMELLNSGEITDSRLQHNITLIEGFTMTDGTRIKPEVYKADFSYIKDGRRIYEDTKGKRTNEYLIKRKQVADKLGILIVEV